MNKKIIALALSIVLAVGSVGCGNILTSEVSKKTSGVEKTSGVASETSGVVETSEADKTSGVVTLNNSSLSHSHEFFYDDLFFYGDNHEYNNSLAILTLGVELAAFSADEKKTYMDDMAEEADGYTARAENIRDAVEADDNIFNVISANDMVPKIPLMHWGFKKYGQVKVLPEYADKLVAAEYKKLTGRSLEVNNMASMWNGTTDSMAVVVPDRVFKLGPALF